ncbi:hypothetical protein PTTG_31157, partial [Puccinia triticina 1-1 BBBD Race 1]
SEPLLPFEESAIEASDIPDDELIEDPVENHPISPEPGKRWVYVQGYQPPKPIESAIDESNIISGGRTRRQVCYISTCTDPKSHVVEFWRVHRIKTPG